MSTQNRQTSTASFDPGSMGVFNSLTSTFGRGISDEINNPYGNMAFNTQLQKQNQAFSQQQGSASQSLLQRARALGINPSSPQYFDQLNKLQRQGMSNQAGGYNNLLLQAAQLRQGALGMAGQYRPLQTGQTQVQTQSGLGSWLPQVAGAGLGVFGKLMGGGAGGSSGGGGGFDYSGAGAGPSGGLNPGMSLSTPGMQDPFGSGTPNPFLQ